jgi:hypothetical protein
MSLKRLPFLIQLILYDPCTQVDARNVCDPELSSLVNVDTAPRHRQFR